ncbi:MAG: hypothetical protein R2856_19860 [Caldilineaceae bacterium]
MDDQFVGYLENYAAAFVTGTLSFDGFGAGVHLLRLEGYRDRLADAFVTPVRRPSPISMRARGHPCGRARSAIATTVCPFAQTAQSWVRVNNIFSDCASGGQRDLVHGGRHHRVRLQRHVDRRRLHHDTDAGQAGSPSTATSSPRWISTPASWHQRLLLRQPERRRPHGDHHRAGDEPPQRAGRARAHFD